MKNFISEYPKTSIISLVLLLLTLFLVNVVNEHEINDLMGKLQTAEVELQKAEEKLEDYEFYLWVLNMQRGDAMRAYEEARVTE